LDFGFFDRKPFSEASIRICEELNNLGVKAQSYNWEEIQIVEDKFMYQGNVMTLPNVAMIESKVRTRAPKNHLRYVFDWLELMEFYGVKFLNSTKSTRVAINKVYAAALLKKVGVRTPTSRAVRTIEQIEQCLNGWKDMILKPISGHASLRVQRFILDESRLKETRSSILNLPQSIEAWHMLEDFHTVCAQEFVVNKGRDIRVEVFKNQVVSIYARNSLPNTWRILDINKGPQRQKFQLTPDVEKIAIDSIKVLGLNYGKIDLVEGEHGLTVIEVNPSSSSFAKQFETSGFTSGPKGAIQYYVDSIISNLNHIN
jgi:tetrahydromethanopterin:alpha-L-glutamate ligase